MLSFLCRHSAPFVAATIAFSHFANVLSIAIDPRNQHVYVAHNTSADTCTNATVTRYDYSGSNPQTIILRNSSNCVTMVRYFDDFPGIIVSTKNTLHFLTPGSTDNSLITTVSFGSYFDSNNNPKVDYDALAGTMYWTVTYGYLYSINMTAWLSTRVVATAKSVNLPSGCALIAFLYFSFFSFPHSLFFLILHLPPFFAVVLF